MSPLILNEAALEQARPGSLEDAGYRPIDPDSGVFNLVSNARGADCDIPYESLNSPVLVVTGHHERVFRDEADIAALSARIPNATRVDIEDARHMVPAEQPAKLARLLLDFACGLPRR